MNLPQILEEELSKIEGVDGFAILNQDTSIVYSNLDPEFLIDRQKYLEDCINKLKFSSLKCSSSTDSGTNSNGQLFLLSEAGAFYIAESNGKYILILAGTKGLVDISKLSRIKDKIVR